jgi:hypothetical protein
MLGSGVCCTMQTMKMDAHILKVISLYIDYDAVVTPSAYMYVPYGMLTTKHYQG